MMEASGRPGHQNSPDNISPNYGTNPTYALKRLKRDRPDLLAEPYLYGIRLGLMFLEAGPDSAFIYFQF